MKQILRALSIPFLIIIILISGNNIITAQLINGNEYYFYNIYYNSILGQKSDDTTPGLSKTGINSDDSYIFIAEESGIEGYYLLRQKSTGNYLTASTSNTWSVVFQSQRATTDNYLWFVTPGFNGSLSCEKSPSLHLGCDTGHETDTYISVFYDKTLNELSRWEIFDASSDFDNSRKQLYLEELLNYIETGNNIVAQESYPDSLKQKVSVALMAADSIYNSNDSTDLSQIIEATETLSLVIIDCLSSNKSTLLSGRNFDVDNSFTIALNDLKQKTDSSSIWVLVRNKNGKGALIEIGGNNKVQIKTKIIAPASTDTIQQHNYQFAFNDTIVKVYRDGTLLGSAPSYFVPAYTNNETNAEWTIIQAVELEKYTPEVISATNALEQGLYVTDKYGNNCRYAVFLNGSTLNLNEAVDFHIMQETNPLINSTINLAHENAWIIFDNTLPSDVVSNYLKFISINGQQAITGSNVRIGVYLNGTIVMPENNNTIPFIGYSSEGYTGQETVLKTGANELGQKANSFQSFVLKRGYMAILASGSQGSGYSRVYVADHHDIKVTSLPQALNKRISSVHIKKWNYVSKKGWCSTTSNSAIATECKKMRATWFYTWSADRNSSYNTEYIPILQHLYWPSINQISQQNNSTHVLSINEPEHAEQHTSDKCSCGGVISPWKACEITPSLQVTGMRIGSPAPTDAGWLNEYIDHCDNMAYRCDFAVMHCYWGTNEAANAQAWYNRLKTIHDNTKRPIWITEWNNGASWTTESWPSGYGDKLEKNRVAIKEILNVLDTCSFIERYSIYNWDSYYRAMIADDGWVTPAGQVYRDNKSTFAYNANVQFTPIWWAPSLKTVTMEAKINATAGKLIFTINNSNGDMTAKLIIQRKKTDGTYENYFSETNRSLFDTIQLTYSFNLSDFDINTDEFRLRVTTLTGEETFSNQIALGYIVNPNIITNNKSTVDGWTCIKSASNGFTKSTGDTYLEVWDENSRNMHFDYYQIIKNIEPGVYELSAACFNSTNGITGDSANGHVGIYAQAEGIEYFSPVNIDSELNTANRQSIPYIVVENDSLRIGIKNLGTMTARWAGADEFKLRYLGNLDDVLSQDVDTFKHKMRKESDARYKALFIWNEDSTKADASPVLINPDCTRKDNYGWRVKNNDYSTGEAFDAVSTNNYWNKWSSSAFTSEMFQDYSYLPAGIYTASMLLRSSAGTNMDFYVSCDDGKTKKDVQTITGIGNISPLESEYKNGWQKVTTSEIPLQNGEKLRIGLTYSGLNNWWSADHLTLQYCPIRNIQSHLPEKKHQTINIEISKQNKGIQIKTTSPIQLKIYTITGVLIYHQQINEGITHIPLSKGIYVVNKKLIIL
ncbi:MAG: hypothetical protein JW717_04700 [Marinilabiliaceae bacterium]|nr:hypothetical protein [Marinilabiliaceae bacterium]